MESRFYPNVEVDVTRLLTELRGLFDSDYEVQTMQVGGASALQARKSSTFLDITGLSSAVTIKVSPEPGGTRVEIGMQKWLDKAAVATVAFFVFPPLLALPAIGAYGQYRITERAWNTIEAHVAGKAGGYVPPLPGRCGNCGAANSVGADFCAGCGSKLHLGVTCNGCGTVQGDPAAKFCNRCGTSLN
jgi:hypothetical protein